MFDIENALGFLLAKCHQKAFTAFKSRLEPYDITPPQFATMAFLWKRDGINQFQLGEAMGVDRTTISGIVERLEKVKLVERKVNPDDRRSTLLYVTDKGKSLEKELKSIALEVNKTLAKNLTEDETKDLIIKLKKIRFD